MACRNANVNPQLTESVSAQFTEIFAGSDREIVGDTIEISRDPRQARQILLERGQHLVRGRVENIDDEEIRLRDFPTEIKIDGEFKRVRFFKLDVIPVEGTNESRFTTKFEVLDNPVWLAPLLWTLPVAGSWFVVDKVETFTDKNPILTPILAVGAIATIAAFMFRS